ncbi:hypothetical protein NST89_03200 [Caldifermentibacillus hisashii]|uniref:hypothetical protein n=1 Tax=Caldifermentibacillus hisashii TaxID=996558 RepID=UPI00313724BF
MTTRNGLVAKKWHFPAKNDDEKRSRRQKIKFSTPKRRREMVSSPKNGVSRPKIATILAFNRRIHFFVVKILIKLQGKLIYF